MVSTIKCIVLAYSLGLRWNYLMANYFLLNVQLIHLKSLPICSINDVASNPLLLILHDNLPLICAFPSIFP